MKLLLALFLLIISLSSFSQTDSISENNFIIPKDISQCITELDNVLSEKSKIKLKNLSADTLAYINDIKIFDEWFDPDSSRLIKYFKDQGLRFEYEMEYFILIAYYKFLWTGSKDISIELKRYKDYEDSVALVKHKECDSLKLLDTINGYYIPKNLFDCYHQLDQLLSDSFKIDLKTSDNLFEYHFSLGAWIRNNMRLWGCSRLKDYFRDNNIRHPDDMSGIIIQGYKLYLNGTICDIQELIALSPPPPPPVIIQEEEKFQAPGIRKYHKLPKKRKLDDFNISDFTMITINIAINYSK